MMKKKKFINLVISGNQNTPDHVKKSFKTLLWVAFLYENDEIIAVSSLKKAVLTHLKNQVLRINLNHIHMRLAFRLQTHQQEEKDTIH